MIRGYRTEEPHADRQDLRNLLRMFPYVWTYRGRVALALAALVIAKMAMVAVPLVLKQIVDALDASRQDVVVLPIVLLLAYGLLRLVSSGFNELRDVVFARVRYHAMHRLSREVLAHLYSLSLRFHLERKTGNISRDLDRGAQSVSSILNYLVFNIVPTAAELTRVTVPSLATATAMSSVSATSTAMSRCAVKTSDNSPSNSRDQTSSPVSASTSRAKTRNSSSLRIRLP